MRTREAEDFGGNLARVRARDADHSQAATARGRRDGDDRIVEIQGRWADGPPRLSIGWGPPGMPPVRRGRGSALSRGLRALAGGWRAGMRAEALRAN
jgi:hypothetical protein